MPYISWRLSLANAFPELAEKAPAGILSYIKRFYYDTALSPSRYSLVSLKELVDPTHILFGSDFPFAPAPVVSVECDTLSKSNVWSSDELYGINRGNALALFQKYREMNEVASQHPIYSDISLSETIRCGLIRPVVSLFGWVQNR